MLRLWYPRLETRLRAPLCWLKPALLPDRHGQNPCPALGYLTCSGMFTKVPSETQNRGMQVCHRVLLQESWLTQQWVCLPTDARSGRWSGGTVRSRMETEDGCTPRPSC